MNDDFGKPRNELIELLTSAVGRMAVRRIDEGEGCRTLTDVPTIKEAVNCLLRLIHQMNRDQLEVCHVELNEFFCLMPFSETIPLVIHIERKWPHYIETLPNANRRLDFVRQSGEYAMIFETKKLENLLVCIEEVQAIRSDGCL